jgi:hypothetical protein
MIEYYANIAEIVGAILVVATLAFLILEIRHNTRALRATTIQAVMQSEMALASFLVDNAETWEKVLAGTPLEPGIEMRKGIITFNVYMLDTENRYHQHLAGLLDSKSREGRRNTLPEIVALPIFTEWRRSFGARSHAADFLALIDDVAAKTLEN